MIKCNWENAQQMELTNFSNNKERKKKNRGIYIYKQIIYIQAKTRQKVHKVRIIFTHKSDIDK